MKNLGLKFLGKAQMTKSDFFNVLIFFYSLAFFLLLYNAKLLFTSYKQKLYRMERSLFYANCKKNGTKKGIIVDKTIPDINAITAISGEVFLAIIGRFVSMAVAPAGAMA